MTQTRARPASPLRHRVRGHVLVLLCVLYAILYFDRVNISTAGPNGLSSDLHLNGFEFGLATTAFALPYALLQVCGGVLGDKIGARRALVTAAVVCGVFTVLTGFVNGIATLFAVRFVLGLAEGGAFPVATRAMSSWLPVDRRGFAQGVVHASSRLSNALAPIIVAALISIPHVGWRGSFVVAGLAGVIWGGIWFRFFRDRPENHPAVQREELSELRASEPGGVTAAATPWRLLVRRLWPVTVTDFGYGWMLWVYLTWMPSFVATQFHLSLVKSAGLTAVIYLGGAVGDWAGGQLSDGILRRTHNLRRARRVGLVIGLVGSAVCVLPVLWLHSVPAVTACLTVAFFFLELCNSPLWSIPMDVAPQHSGAASGLMNTGFGIAGVIAAPVFGFIADHAGYPIALAFSAVLLVVGLVAVRFISVQPLRHPEIDGAVAG